MQFKPLNGRRSRARRWKQKRAEYVVEWRLPLLKAWGEDKTDREILTELELPYTETNIRRLYERATLLRKSGDKIPYRGGGSTVTHRRTSFARFWNQLEKKTQAKADKVTYAPRAVSGRRSKNLLSILKESMTTNEILNQVPYCRVVLLGHLRSLESRGKIAQSMNKYQGSGRGFRWTRI